MENVTDNASHSEEITPEASPQAATGVNEALEMFGIEPTEPVAEAEEEAPSIETEPEPERKGRTYKYNKEEVFVPEDQVDEYARKGLNYDKIEGRAKDYEAALERTAKLNGFSSHKEYLENLDRLEQEAIQHKEDSFQSLRQAMVDQYTEAGWDPQQLEEFLDNNPLLQQAKEVLDREKTAQESVKAQEAQAQQLKGWEDLFAKYPHLAEETPEVGTASWYTPDIQAKIQRGYDPIDAYELVNRDAIAGNQRKLAEQDVLKQQRLNKRAAVLGNTSEDLAPSVPKELSDAFALFGIEPQAAQKYVKK
ncbi:hypothetical protein [Paenibacillus sp. FSL L8-0494]|uniref:hypothetical protein n=1 Tax=Paenibacillus sp. FSL L8-0494 TaxID=2975352 RepID=UPI0030FC6B73